MRRHCSLGTRHLLIDGRGIDHRFAARVTNPICRLDKLNGIATTLDPLHDLVPGHAMKRGGPRRLVTRAYDVDDLRTGQLVECVTLAVAIGNLTMPTDTAVIGADKESSRRHLTTESCFANLIHEKKSWKNVRDDFTTESKHRVFVRCLQP